MGVSAGVVTWLRNHGHDVACLPEQGLQKLADTSIFLKAGDEARVVLTFDLDFGEILALSGGRTVSVILFRLNNTITPFVIQRLQSLLSEEDAIDLLESGAIIVVEDGRHRIRRLPLGR